MGSAVSCCERRAMSVPHNAGVRRAHLYDVDLARTGPDGGAADALGLNIVRGDGS